jgi:hypothetical protein
VDPKTLEEVKDDSGAKALSGNTCSSLYRLKDMDGSFGGFFVFPDLFVNIEGRFRLKFTLYELGYEMLFNFMSRE